MYLGSTAAAAAAKSPQSCPTLQQAPPTLHPQYRDGRGPESNRRAGQAGPQSEIPVQQG